MACQQAAVPPEKPPSGPTAVVVEAPIYNQLKTVEAETDEVIAAMQDGWVLVNCSIGFGAAWMGSLRTQTEEHCYFVRGGDTGGQVIEVAGEGGG